MCSAVLAHCSDSSLTIGSRWPHTTLLPALVVASCQPIGLPFSLTCCTFAGWWLGQLCDLVIGVGLGCRFLWLPRFVIRVPYVIECTGLTSFFSRSAVVCNRSAAVMKNHVPGISLTREGLNKCVKPRIRFVWKKWLKFRKVTCKVAAP